MNDNWIARTCPCCGGNEVVEDLNSNAALCAFCGTTFILKSGDEHSSAKKLDNAELFFYKLHDYNKARQYYQEAVELDPSNFRGWWGLAKVATGNFKRTDLSDDDINNIHDNYIANARVTASPDVGAKINKIFGEYLITVYQHLNFDYEIQIKTQEILEREQDLQIFSKQVERYDAELRAVEAKQGPAYYIRKFKKIFRIIMIITIILTLAAGAGYAVMVSLNGLTDPNLSENIKRAVRIFAVLMVTEVILYGLTRVEFISNMLDDAYQNSKDKQRYRVRCSIPYDNPAAELRERSLALENARHEKSILEERKRFYLELMKKFAVD